MKKHALSICLSFSALFMYAQIPVSIPDPNFKAALIGLGVDINKDGEIDTEEAAAVKTLELGSKSINSLVGLAYFVNLKVLECPQNNLDSIDVSKNIFLTQLTCSNNQLTSLDVSKNTALLFLACDNNALKSLDVSNNTALYSLFCPINQLSALDVSKNADLVELDCVINPGLKLICLNSAQLASLDSTKFIKNPSAQWSADCKNVTGVIDNQSTVVGKTLLGIFTVYGANSSEAQAQNGVYLYHYSDGSIKKMMR